MPDLPELPHQRREREFVEALLTAQRGSVTRIQKMHTTKDVHFWHDFLNDSISFPAF